jgi:hypothetical protein
MNWFLSSDPTQIPTARQYIWRMLRFLSMTAIVMLLLEYLKSRWFAVEFRPLSVLLFVSIMAVCGVIGAWWQLHRLRRKEDPSIPKWPQFSLRELFILMTLLSICGMFMGLEIQQRQWETAAYERLSQRAAPLLGEAGGIHRNSDGLVIDICNPGMNDKSFAKLAKLIREEQLDDSIKSIMFAIPANTTSWQITTGVTDRSLVHFSHWPNLKQVAVDSTGISAQGKEELSRMPRLEEMWKKQLLDTTGNMPEAHPRNP